MDLLDELLDDDDEIALAVILATGTSRDDEDHDDSYITYRYIKSLVSIWIFYNDNYYHY